MAFFAIYLWTTWQSARRLASPMPTPDLAPVALWAPVVALAGLSAALTLAQPAWGTLFIYTAACAAGRLSPAPLLYALAGIFALSIGVGVLLGEDPGAAVSGQVWWIVIAGVTVMAMAHLVTTSQRLRAEREEMARRAAVSEERLRIARDLRDLLGRNLSLIALKSELAGRLAGTAPERAAREIGDVERVARHALAEVREAVAGYCQPSLADELRGVREMLAAAGIGYTFEGDESAANGLPPAAEAVVSWTVREAVTNIIRHSRAALAATPDVALLDIEMPGGDGLDAAKALRERLPTCHVLILTTFGRPGYLRRAMESGAAGFLLKDAPAPRLAAAIRRVMAGERVVDPALALAALSEGSNPLTERERDVLIAASGGASVAAIAGQLALSEGTVRNYLSVAIQKLGARSRVEAARIAEQKGWL